MFIPAAHVMMLSLARPGDPASACLATVPIIPFGDPSIPFSLTLMCERCTQIKSQALMSTLTQIAAALFGSGDAILRGWPENSL